MNERGNALFLILIAVALFAALSYAITNSSRGGGDTSRETEEIAISQVLQFANSMSVAIQRLTLFGCADDEITFEDNGGFSHRKSGLAYDYTNLNAPGDESCHVFSPNGGAVSTQELPENIMVGRDEIADGHMDVNSIFVQPMITLGLGSDTPGDGTDIMLWIGFVRQDVCMRINDRLGVPNPSNLPPSDSYSCLAPFVGNYPNCSQPFGDQVTGLAGQDTFCVTVGNYLGKDTYSLIKMIHIR